MVALGDERGGVFMEEEGQWSGEVSGGVVDAKVVGSGD